MTANDPVSGPVFMFLVATTSVAIQIWDKHTSVDGNHENL